MSIVKWVLILAFVCVFVLPSVVLLIWLTAAAARPIRAEVGPGHCISCQREVPNLFSHYRLAHMRRVKAPDDQI